MAMTDIRSSVTRSTPHDGFVPPSWWKPWSSQGSLMAQTRETVKAYGNAPFMTWLDDRGREGVWATSNSIARRMKEDWGVQMGDRVLLCYLPGTSFVVAYWACLRLRVIAVPAYPPDPNKLALGLKKLALVSKSCAARLCLTERALEQMRIALSLTHTWPQDLVWRRTDDLRIQQATPAVNDRIDAPIEGSAVAFLQYTSGSTGDPKGVMLTFANMFHNISEMYLPGQLRHLARRGVEHEWGADLASGRRVIGVSWLPQFHDTGLVLCIVAPFVAGYRMINFSPLTFLRTPLLWLKALSKYGVHWSAAPDFAYELCVRRLAETTGLKQYPLLDLSSVRQFACGAGERCRPVQLSRFLETFAAFGLRHDIYVPNYGLAEHVVGTCGCAGGIKVSKARPDLACCGEDFQCDLRIVCPVTRVEKAVGEPGEIWVSSMSVAAGYWGMPELTRKTFEARLSNSMSPHYYLRTGDEGFFEEGPLGLQLYICGRLKDVIIVGGKNYYPEDIEAAVQEADRENIRPGCVAAFAAQDGGTATGDETVTCVFELRHKALKKFESSVALASLSDKVSRAVGVTAGLRPGRIVIISERTIPKTTSGKVQRRQTRSLLDSRGLSVLYDSSGEHPTLSETSRSSTFSLMLSDNWLTKTMTQAFAMFSLAVSSAPAESEPRNLSNTPSREAPAETAAPSDTQNLFSTAKQQHDAVNYPQSIKTNGHAIDEEVAKTADVLLAAVREVVSGPCTPSTAFHELGLSSRQTVELLRRVERDVDVELPPTLVFSCPTVGALALEICKLRRGDLVVSDRAEEDGIRDVPTAASPKLAGLKVNSVAARLPGCCEDVAFGLRALIDSRHETATEVPFQRWDVDAVNMRRAHSTARTRASYGAFCRGSMDFEPQKFGMGQAETSSLDPQQRLFLERAYEALYAAGYRKNAQSEPVSRRSLFARAIEEVHTAEANVKTQTIPLVGANVAVCLGMMNMDAAFSIQPEDVGPHDLTGNGYSSAGSRLSFSFDMRGPCVVVDTACSASLVAGHTAARFVSTYEADSGLFAGTSLMLAPSFIHVGVAIAGMTSLTGRCHTFDAAADGYCRGEGSAVVVLGRSDETDVSRALRVTAAGFAIKHNGKSATFTALNSLAQTRLMEATPGARATLAVEAHGTGTKLGDPIEISGLAALKKTELESKTLISGVKANLGHTEPTAGNAGYLAALLVVASNAPQPNARLYSVNPVARLDRVCSIAPALDNTPSGSKSSEFSIGVSSFGYSGIIAHAVIVAATAGASSERKEFVPAMKIFEGNLSLTPPNIDDRVILRRRGSCELDQLLRLSRRLTRRSAVPDPKHIWLLQKEGTKTTEPFVLNIKQHLWNERGYDSSISSRLIEVALAVAQAIGAVRLLDITIAATRKYATRCIVDASQLYIETDDGESALIARIESTASVPKPLRRCVITKPPTMLSSSVLLRDQVGIAWDLGNEEIRGLVVQSPHRMESPTLRSACLEAICQMTSFLSSRPMEWTSIDEVYMHSDVDVVSSRAWARIQTCENRAAAKATTSVNCDINSGGRFLALRGAKFQQRHIVPARVDNVSVYEIGWRKAKKPITPKKERSRVTVIMKLTGQHLHASASACLLNNFDTVRARFRGMPRVVLVVSTEEHFAYSWSKGGNTTPATCSLPHGLRRVGWQGLDVMSSHTLCSAKDELLEFRMEPLIVVANPSTYKQAACSGDIHAIERRPNVTVEVCAAHLLTLAVRAIGDFTDSILLNTSRLSASVATHLSHLLRHRKPKIVIGNGTVPAWLHGHLHSSHGDEVRVIFCADGFGSPFLDPSRISTGICAGLAPRNAWGQQRRRLAGCRSIALLGPPSASAIRAGIFGTCSRGGATMVAWAAAILMPSPDLHNTLQPRLHVDSLLEGNTAVQPGRQQNRQQQKKSVRRIVNEVVEHILGSEVISTSFSELSMDSLQGTEIAHELSNRLGREVPPILLSEADNVDDLVKALGGDSHDEGQEETATLSITFGEAANFTRAQKRILPSTFKCAEATPDQELLFWMSRSQTYFTWLPVTAIGDLIGDIDVEALKRAINVIVRRHEALRSRLVRVQLDGDNDRTLFIVDDDDSRYPKLEVRDVGNAMEARRETQAYHDEYENNAFASQSPFRALLVRYPSVAATLASANGHQASMNGVLYVSINHAVSDGWSQQLLYNDLVTAYNNNGYFPGNRSEPARRYCDFLAWHNEEVARILNEPAVVIQNRNYASASRLPSLWPTLCPRDEVEDVLFASGSLLHNDLMAVVAAPRVAALEAKLRSEAPNLGRASLPSVVLAAYLVALGDVKMGKAVAVQYSHSGRIGHPDLAETYGQLATDMNVVIPCTPTHNGAARLLGPFISNVHKAVLHSFNLAFVPYSIAYRTASNGKRTALPPQYNWYDRYSDVPKWRGLEAKEISVDQTRMRLRTFNVGALYLMALVQSDGSLMMKFFYNNRVYARSTILLAIENIKKFIDLLITDGPGTPLASIE